ncbi:helix-turn-helix transcriptional regulator [Luteimonas sp. MJ174]|uniref:helix-turn-helix domain-containing protein n=1 Tax=Luteimonas sp. MJ174 TaxID=3129237 RepID=UPI0031BAD4ED
MIIFAIEIQLVLRFKLKERIADLEFRERKRVQLQEIAAATGLNRMTLSKLANQHGANVQTDVLDKLCTYFGCRIEELVEHVPDGHTEHPDIAS